MAVTFPLWVKLGAKDDASKELLRFGSVLKSVGGSMKSVGRSMTGFITLPTIAVGVTAIKTAADFEYAMNRVAALTSAGGDDLAKLKLQARQLGDATQYSAQQAAEAQGNLAQAGFKVNEILAATPGILNLAASSALDLGETAAITAKALKSFQLNASESDRLADLFTIAATRANQNLTELGEAFKFGGPVAKGFGMSIEETTAILSKFADVGFSGGLGGTALKQALSELGQIQPSGLKVLHKYGIAMTDIFDKTGRLKDFTGLLEKLAIAGIQPADVFKVFSTRAAPPVLNLLSGGIETVRGFTAELEEVGVAARTAGILMSGTKGAVEKLSSATEGLLIKTAEEGGLIEAITDLVKGATAWVDRLQQAGPETVKNTVKMAAFAAVLGPVIFGLGATVTGVANLIVFLKSLSPVLAIATGGVRTFSAALWANPVFWVTGAVVLLTFAIWRLSKSFDSVGAASEAALAKVSKWMLLGPTVATAEVATGIRKGFRGAGGSAEPEESVASAAIPLERPDSDNAYRAWQSRMMSNLGSYFGRSRDSKVLIQVEDKTGKAQIRPVGSLAPNVELDVGRAMED